MENDLRNKLIMLDEETDHIFEELEHVDPLLHTKNGKGWSLIQVLSHLQMSEEASLNYMKKKIKAGEQMPKTTWWNKFKMWFTCGFLSSSLKWKAPSYIANPPGDYSLNDIRSKWKETREAIWKYVEEYPRNLLDRTVFKHPMAGRQALNEAVDSLIYHQRHHVHQIKRIRKELNS